MAKECIIKTLSSSINGILEIFDCPNFCLSDAQKLNNAIASSDNKNLVFALAGFCNEMSFYIGLISSSCNAVVSQNN